MYLTIKRIIDKLNAALTINLKKSFESNKGVPKNSNPSSKIRSNDIILVIFY
tara:strand:- start:1645 stop:1800 length:156 start_codon:yes stop_codon:yes gene_type:complete